MGISHVHLKAELYMTHKHETKLGLNQKSSSEHSGSLKENVGGQSMSAPLPSLHLSVLLVSSAIPLPTAAEQSSYLFICSQKIPE